MNYIFIPIIIGLVAMVVISLGRGLHAFLQSTREDAERAPGSGATEMQLKQNRMMWARIKYQFAAVLVVALLLAISR